MNPAARVFTSHPSMRAPCRAANDNAGQRHGYVLGMWTGLFEGDDGLPMLFPTIGKALAHLRSYPAWGRTAVTVYRCTVCPNGEGGRPDYILGRAVAYGHLDERTHR